MGIRVELPATRKKKNLTLRERRLDDAVSSEWPSFLRQDDLALGDSPIAQSSIPDVAKLPTAAVLETSTSSKHLMSSPYFTSPPVSPQAGTPSSFASSSADSSNRRKLKKKSGPKPESLYHSGGNETSSWRQSRWDEQWSPDFRPQIGSSKGGICTCAAGVTADIAAVCCCPLSLLHLLGLALVKFPSAVMYRTLASVKRRVLAMKRKSSVHKMDDYGQAPSLTPSRNSMSHAAGDADNWVPTGGFADSKVWQDYFDSPDTGVWSSGELRRVRT